MNIVEYAQQQLDKQSALYRRPGAGGMNVPSTIRTSGGLKGGAGRATPAVLQSAKGTGVMPRRKPAKPATAQPSTEGITPDVLKRLNAIPADHDPSKRLPMGKISSWVQGITI